DEEDHREWRLFTVQGNTGNTVFPRDARSTVGRPDGADRDGVPFAYFGASLAAYQDVRMNKTLFKTVAGEVVRDSEHRRHEGVQSWTDTQGALAMAPVQVWVYRRGGAAGGADSNPRARLAPDLVAVEPAAGDRRSMALHRPVPCRPGDALEVVLWR